MILVIRIMMSEPSAASECRRIEGSWSILASYINHLRLTYLKHLDPALE